MNLVKFSLKLAILLSVIAFGTVYEATATQSSSSGTKSTLTVLQRKSFTPEIGLKTSSREQMIQGNSEEELSLYYASATSLLVGGGIVVILLVIAAIARPKTILGLVVVPDRKVGIVIKHLGRPVPSNQVIAREGEAGPQADTLSSGWHFWYWSWMYAIRLEDVVDIAGDEIAWVEAKDGALGTRGQTFGQVVICDNFQNAKAFLNNGGQRGKQSAILTTGTYRINTELFTVHKEKLICIKADEIGLVEAQDGAQPETGRSFAKAVECNNFQDEQKFFTNGGQRGLQTAILKEGTYQINPALFKVRVSKVTSISPEEIGLVEALGGITIPQGRNFGTSVECNDFQDAQAFLDNYGQKGKQLKILGIGTYYINTGVFNVRVVPVTKIDSDEIGLVDAQDGAPLESGQTLGKVVDCHNFEDANAFISQGGQKGKQLAVLPTGNYQINTDLFRVRKISFTEINSGKIGLVEAWGGSPLKSGQILGKVVDCNEFQDAQAFIDNGGQKGKQLGILMAGKYQINTDLFKIRIVDAIKISPEQVGLVEAKGGAFLKPGQSFGQVVDCDKFQDVSAFLSKGGQAGWQLTILTTGTYYINTDFFDIRIVPAIQVTSDQIGLVEAKAGAPLETGKMFGKAVECDYFQDAQVFLDNGGQKGKQLAILTAGTYQINTDLFNVRLKSVITIAPEEIGLVEAKDGASLEQEKIFGKAVECDYFQDPQKFLVRGGQRGQQLAVLSEGTYSINTDLFSVRKEKMVLVGPDELGLVIANDGAPLERAQTLARVVDCNDFQDAQAFLDNGGQKGKQLAILTAGRYRINTDLFTVITPANAIQHGMSPKDLRVTAVSDNNIGIVTTYDGMALATDEIAGSVIPGHEKFQNAQKFIDGGGQQGLQEEILPAGRWNLNPWFVKVNSVPLTEVPNGHVGVIKSYVGQKPVNHEKLVEIGYKGICKTPLRPGRYPINTATQDIVIVPTNDLVLKWSGQKGQAIQAQEAEVHKALPALQVHDKNGFDFAVEVTQVIRVKEEDAPEILCNVASTINSIDELIKEVLEPTVINYFLNAAQKREALDFQEYRDELQAAAKQHIKEALKAYSIQAVDTLIGEISLPKDLTEPLRESKLAEQRIQQFKRKADEEEHRQKFLRAEEMAKSEVEVAKEQQKANIAAIQRLEESKKLEEARKQKREDLALDQETKAVALEQKRVSSKVEALARKLMVDIELMSDRERRQIEADFQKALNQMATDEMKLIQSLSPEVYVQIKGMEAAKQQEIAKAIALIHASVASQSYDLEKVKAVANIRLPDNPQFVMGNDAAQAISGFGNPLGSLVAQLTNSLGQSAPTLLNQLRLGQLGFSQPNLAPQLEGSVPVQLPPNQPVAYPSTQYPSVQPAEQPRCPVLLLLDTSASMTGECIQKLNEGIASFKQEVQQDKTATERLEVTVVTFNQAAQTLQRFGGVDQLLQSKLVASGPSNMGQGIGLALQEIESRTSFYRNQNIQFHKPWVFLITAGCPSDDWQDAAQQVREAVEANKLNFFVVGIQGADITTLRQVASPNIPPVMLDQLKFHDLFHWLANSMRVVANSSVGSSVNLSPITTWAQVN